MNITRLTSTLLLVSVALDSELSADSSFMCTHTQLWHFVSELVFVYDVYCKPLQSKWEYNLILIPHAKKSLGTRLGWKGVTNHF